MACTTEEIKRDSLKAIRELIKGNAQVVSFTKNGDALITPSKDSTKIKTKNSARKMAEQKIEAINKWSKEKFKTDAYTGQWASISESPTDFRIALTFPKGLEDEYNKKMAQDEARAVQMEDAKRNGISEDDYDDGYQFDYMPTSADGYNYGLYVDNKERVRNYVSQRIKVLEEVPNKSKKDLEQIEELKETKRRLNKDLVNLYNETNVLDNFFSYFNNDLETIKDILLENPSIDNLMASRVFIDNMKFILGNEGQKFSDVFYQDIEDVEHRELFKNFANNFNNIEKALDKAEIDFTQKHITSLLEGNENNESIDKDVQELTDKVKSISDVATLILPIDTDSDASPLQKFVRKVYDDAIGKNETYDLRNKLLNLQEELENKLVVLGYANKNSFIGGLGSKVTYDLFQKGNKLIGKFSPVWNTFNKSVSNRLNDIQELVYSKADFAEIKKQRRNLFSEINENSTFLDVRKIPEFVNRPDLQANFGNFFKIQEADTHKEELIQSLIGQSGNRAIAERIYNKMVEEQLSKIHSFEISMDQYKNRLLKKNGVDNISELSEKDRNNLLAKYYTESPFAFAENYEATGKSDVAKIYYQDGEQKQALEPSTLEYVSYIPSKREFFDEDFEQKIEHDDVLFKAWELFDDGYNYINENRKYEKDDNEHNTNDLTYQYDMIGEHNQGIVKLGKYLTKRASNFIKTVISTSKYVPLDKVSLKASQSIQSLEEVINSQLRPVLATLRVKKIDIRKVTAKNELKSEDIAFLENITGKSLPDTFIIEELLRESYKNKVLNKQNLNMVNVLTSQLEMVETFKAKKEIETIMLFAKNQIEKIKQSSDTREKKNAIKLVNSFINRHLYGVNNRANWTKGRQNDSAIAKLFSSNEKETIQELEKAITLIKTLTKNADNETKLKAEEEIRTLQSLIDSKGRVVTGGSIFELFAMRTAILVGLGLNLPSQLKNIFMGNVAGRQNDGLEWTEGNYHKAASYTRKWKIARRKLSSAERQRYKLTNTLINSLGVFQNSANELDRIKELSYKKNIGDFISNPLHIVGEAEKTIQRPQILAILGDVDITDKNGNIVKAFNTEDTKNPHPAFTLDPKGNIILKPEFDTEENRATWINRNSQEYVNLFGNSGIVPRVIAKINGDYRSTSTTVVKETSLGSLAMLFKTWLPAYVLRRYGKQDGVISGLAESDRVSEAAALTSITAGMYAAIGGSILISPIIAIGLTATYLGYRKHKKLIQQEGHYFMALMKDIQKSITSLQFMTNTIKFGVNTARIAGATGLKVAQQGTDLAFGNRFISNDIISQVAGFEKKAGETDVEFQKNLARLHFLLTEASTTLTLLMLKVLANAVLFPDDDEEKKFKENDGLIEKLKNDPRVTLYYFLENTLSGMASDMNLLNDPYAFAKTFLDGSSSSFLTNWSNLLASPLTQYLDGDYQTGPNAGKNRIGVQLGKVLAPKGLVDFSLGFNKISQQDYQKKDLINRQFMSDFKKYEEERKSQYNEYKEQLIEEYTISYPYKTKEQIKEKAQKKAMKKYPTIHKYFEDSGEIKQGKQKKVEKYENN